MNRCEKTEFQLVVGFTASNGESSERLLSDLLALSQNLPELAEIVVCDNLETSEGVLSRLGELGKGGIETVFLPRPEIRLSAKRGDFGDYYARDGFQKGIAFSRTVLHHHLYLRAGRFDNPVVWILDDDIRLDKGVISHPREFQELLRSLKSHQVDIAVGRISGDPPIPGASMIRSQLLDFDFNLRAMSNHDAPWNQEVMKRRDEENARRFPDFYYDMSLLHTAHLETPWWYVEEQELNRLDALETMLDKVRLISVGVNLFRRPPCQFSTEYSEGETTPTRGANTLVMNMNCLRNYPNISPIMDGLVLRRGDTLWTILNKRTKPNAERCKVVSAEFTVIHDRRHNSRPIFDSNDLLSDIMGSAFTRAVDQFLQSASPVKPTISFDSTEISTVLRIFEENIAERVSMLELNSWRIQGLVSSIRKQLRVILDAGGPEAEIVRKHQDGVSKLLEDCQESFSPTAIDKIKRAAHSYPREHLQTFLRELPAVSESYRRKLPATSAPHDAAESFLRRHVSGRRLRFLAEGKEAVVLTDEVSAYKFFRDGIRNFSEGQLGFLREKLSSATTNDIHHILPLERVISEGDDVVFVTKLVRGDTYKGGSLNDILDLLRECKKIGIALTNLSPENVIASKDGLVYIDLGRSIEALDVESYREMCKRAFLVYRWHFRPDLKDLFRSALSDESLPELQGFDSFLEALEEKDIGEIADGARVEMVLKEKRLDILDYGCGNGLLSDKLASSGAHVTAYDIDRSGFDRYGHHEKVEFVGEKEMQRSVQLQTKFELIFCSRVVCVVNDTEACKIFSEMRALLRDDGVLILALCNPLDLGNVESQTHVKQFAMLPDYEANFSYEKRVKSTNRWRREYHRPVSWYVRQLRTAGFDVTNILETPGVDIPRLRPGSELLLLRAITTRGVTS